MSTPMIYLDNAATTPICQAALDAYVEASQVTWGNPSSRHGFGKMAEDAIREVREEIKASIGAKDGVVVFTAGGTEANNLALFGRALSKPRYLKGMKIITTAGEHASISHPLHALAQKGFRVVEIPTIGGKLDLDALERELTPDVILLTMMMVNNESGAVYDLATVSRMMKRACPEAVLHVDDTQAYMKLPLSVKTLGADLVTLSSHKIEGPKGVGALWISQDLITKKGIVAQCLGGGQEGNLRSGTENVPGIVAFGAAVKYKRAQFATQVARLQALKDRLLMGLGDETLLEVKVNLPPVAAPHIVSLTLPKIKSETMLHFLSSKGIYVSSGSACSSHDGHLSSGMLSYGLSESEADTTIRVSLGAGNTEEDVDLFLAALKEGVESLIRVRK